MKNQFDVRFNFLNTIYKAWLTLRKFNFELKLRNQEKKMDVGNWKHGNLISSF